MRSLHRIIRSSTLTAVVASVVALPVAAQTRQQVDLRGVVVDRSTGAAVPGALIQVERRSATTDGDGRFLIRRLQAGEHGLIASHLGYSNLVTVVQVDTGGEPVRLALDPNPVLLEAIRVVVDRLKARRNSLPFSVRAFEERDMAFASTAYDFLRSRLHIGRCPSTNPFTTDCVWRRGSWVSPEIYIDEVPYRFAGLDILDTYSTSELHTIEVFNSGTQIRVYTKWFTDRLARGRAHLTPIIVW